MSSIAVRQHTFDVGPLPFSHNFLVLYDDAGKVVAELHGWAFDPNTGKRYRGAIGRSSHNLEAFERNGKFLYDDGQAEKTFWQGPESDAMVRWQAAKDALAEVNNRKLTYNLWGSDLNGPRDWDAPPPAVIAGNSNSVNRTAIDAMGLRLPSMPTMAPGTENELLPQSLIDQIQSQQRHSADTARRLVLGTTRRRETDESIPDPALHVHGERLPHRCLRFVLQ